DFSGWWRVGVDSPPHRWLRNLLCFFIKSLIYSPPHRWLRNL
ncbi:hypothetical protein, partial [uncultured Gammaproteobacteria bacterium]